ncbi:hypothetical protein CY34DRAFT_361305 [Suillus luteus UH-Slu-Lm8-n1]|uniref:Uncharacterized protein n=1 Tax=Suillus luteus UH-Slu-Lm8-n1 TaxID=930992 RepID=A0A0D0ALQ2_9AGAM|nr:hypothetical protein CY34DRAFT_361305 [Suillus luteus UH-Slu-Lm8-n1]
MNFTSLTTVIVTTAETAGVVVASGDDVPALKTTCKMFGTLLYFYNYSGVPDYGCLHSAFEYLISVWRANCNLLLQHTRICQSANIHVMHSRANDVLAVRMMHRTLQCSAYPLYNHR